MLINNVKYTNNIINYYDDKILEVVYKFITHIKMKIIKSTHILHS